MIDRGRLDRTAGTGGPGLRPGAFTALTLAALAVLVLLPIGTLLATILGHPGSLAAATGRTALLALRNSLESSVSAALLATAIGAGAALLTGLTDVRGRGPFAFLFVLSMMIAPQVAALGYIAAFGPSSTLLATVGLAPPPGTAHPLRSAGGIIVVLALHHAPLAFVTLRAGLSRLPRDLVEAAALDGAGRWTTLVRIVLPLLRGHLVAALLLCFVAALGNFGVPALLGAGANYPTVPTLIYRRLTGFGPGVIADMAALSAWLLAMTALGLLLARLGLGPDRSPLEDGRAVDRFWTLGRWRPIAEGGLAALLAVGLLVPVLALVGAALVPTHGVPLTVSTVTADNLIEVLWRQAATWRALANSSLYAAWAAVLAGLLALPIGLTLVRSAPRWRHAAEALFEWPYAIPGIVLALAMILVFLKPIPVLRISLYGTGTLIVLAYVARFLVLVLKPTLAAMDQLDPSVDEAAQLCGAGPWSRLAHIVLPAVAPSIGSGALMVILIAFNELTVSALLWSGRSQTLGVVMFGLEEAGLTGQAAAISLVGLVVAVLAMAAADRLHPRLPAGTLPWR